ncbi:MAG: arginine ABC transporter permease [Coriobacteriia bacterium]|uniref:amino acid ABC transporter permease n=1 Tax=Paratractidigestivibacter sp. TaxID=2847316 RepID=UPI000D79D074|nr:MAG: arginine ABC transporter permease [Coriobacteriia bacterium]
MRFDLLQPYIPMFQSGLAVTCEITAAALVIAFALGALIAVGKVLPCRPLRAVLGFYTSVFRGVPLIVLLFLVYFATPQLTGYKIDMFTASVLTLGLNGSATVSETLRGGIEDVDAGQYDAARSIGLPYSKMMRLIVIPDALHSVAPALVNEVITVLKSSSLVATIGLMDMMRAAQSVQALTYRAFEPFLAVAVVYYLIVMALVAVSRRLERRLRER